MLPSPNQAIDLSKFPKIVPPSPQEQKAEVDRRSQGITTIRSIMENLINAMQSYLTDLSDLDGKARILDQREQSIYSLDTQIRHEAQELEVRKKAVDEEKGYIESKNNEIKEK